MSLQNHPLSTSVDQAPKLVLAWVLLLAFVQAPGSLGATAGDVSDRMEFLGNPLTARLGPNDSGNKRVNHIYAFEDRLFIGHGSTNNPNQVDVWSYLLDRQAFNLELRIDQETVAQFREFDGGLYINSEDWVNIGSNVNFYRAGVWTTSFVRFSPSNPGYPFGAAHSRDIMYFDGKLFSTNGNNSAADIVISENDGLTWRQSTGGPVRETLRFMPLGDTFYAIPVIFDQHPWFRYTPEGPNDFTLVPGYEQGLTGGLPFGHGLFFHVKDVQFNGAVYYRTGAAFWRVTQFEPTHDITRILIPGATDLPNAAVADHKVRDGVLRVLITNPVTSGTFKYYNRSRVFETTDGTTWTEVFRVIPPVPMMRFTNLDWDGDDFYLSGENDNIWHHDSGQPSLPNNQMGAIYRYSLSASGRPQVETVSHARLLVQWVNNTGGQALSWEIARRPAQGDTWTPIATVPASTLAYEDSGLAPGTTYSYRVRATYAGADPSDWSKASVGTTAVNFVAPVQADAYVQGLGSPDTNYGASTELNFKQQFSRKVYLRFDARDFERPLKNASLNFTFSNATFTGADLTNGIDIRLYALNPGTTAGNGKLGEEWSESAITFNNAPANNTGSTNALLTGSGTTNGGQAQILGTYTLPGDSIVGDSVSLGGPALTAFLNSAPPGPVTFVLTRVTGEGATNTHFASKESINPATHPTLIFVPESLAEPAPPANLSANATGPSHVELAWTAPDAPINEFAIERRSGSGAWQIIAILPSNTTEYVDTTTLGATAYTYRVRAENYAGPSPWSGLAQIITPPPTPPYEPPVTAHWRFDESSGAIAADSSGNNFNASFSGSPSWIAGQIGNAIHLTDTANRGQVADHPEFNGMDRVTIAAWVRPANLDGGANARFIISKRTSTTDGVFSLLFWTDNRLFVDLDGNNNRFGSSTVFQNNTWYHVAVVYDGNLPTAERVRLYVNGQLDTIATESSPVLNTNSAPVWIGQANTGGTSKYNGAIDDLRFYRKALAPAIIPTLMSPGNLPAAGSPLPPLRATASASHSGSLPSHAVDGDPETRWTADGIGQWLDLDLGAVLPVGGVQIAWFSGDQRRAFFRVETSIDGVNFSPAFEGESSGTTTAFENYSFASRDAHYLRITNLGNSIAGNTFISIFEARPLGGIIPDLSSLPQPGTYGFWRNAHFNLTEQENPQISGPTATPAGDGMPNALKHFMGLDPWLRGEAFLPDAVLSPDGETLRFYYRRSRHLSGVAGGPVWSDNLIDWHSTGISETVIGTDADAQEVVAEVPVAGRLRLFMRLRVQP